MAHFCCILVKVSLKADIFSLMTLRFVALATLLSLSAFGLSQDDVATPLNPNELTTNLAGATTTADPQTALDPVNSSDADIDAAGFPPRPDQNQDREAYLDWIHMVRSSKARVRPTLQISDPHGLMRSPDSAPRADGALTSYNWSGYVLNNDATKADDYHAFRKVRADFTVPTASQFSGTCTGGWTFASSWAGLDGAGTPDVLQAGVEADAYCDPNGKDTFYSAWYEWFPDSAVRVTNLPVAPGNEIHVSVWASDETHGHIFILNYNTGLYTVVNLKAPAGVKLVGNSAEWIVERPGASALSSYVAQFVTGARALDNNGSVFGPGSNGSIKVVMLGDNNKTLSHPTLLGGKAIVFRTKGYDRTPVSGDPAVTVDPNDPPSQPSSPIDRFPHWLSAQ